jgi:hypothetical protein
MATRSNYLRPELQPDKFASSVRLLADKLGLEVNLDPMPISKFKASSGSLLNASLKSLQQLSRGRDRYLVLTEGQVIALANFGAKPTSLADTLASIKALSTPIPASAVMVRGAKQEQYSLTKRTA